jgi:hypothetical protein
LEKKYSSALDGVFGCEAMLGCRKELWIGLPAYNLIRTVMFHGRTDYAE